MDYTQEYIRVLRTSIERQYRDHPTGCGTSFDEILCYEIHEGGLTFVWLAKKWGINLPTLGDILADHCRRLQELPHVDHNYRHE